MFITLTDVVVEIAAGFVDQASVNHASRYRQHENPPISPIEYMPAKNHHCYNTIAAKKRNPSIFDECILKGIKPSAIIVRRKLSHDVEEVHNSITLLCT